MALDWSKPLCTKHDRPLIGLLLPEIPATGPKRRVAMCSTSASKPWEHLTVYRYGEDGISRVDGQPSDQDLVNFDQSDGRDRMALHPDTLKGQF